MLKGRVFLSPQPAFFRAQWRKPSFINSHHFRFITTILPAPKRESRKINKLLVANRGEIAIRICRAAKELGIKSVSVYPKEDAGSLHCSLSDESFLIGKDSKGTPVEAYLNIDELIRVAKEANADAIHPGYGFLSENPAFSKAVEDAGIMFIGPHHTIVHAMGDKIEARKIAQESKTPVIPGTDVPLANAEQALEFSKKIGYPVILKAAYGGGGRGMRKVMNEGEMAEMYERAYSEAKSAFGKGDLFLEKLITNSHHIEVQILGDHYGNIVHLYERDCTIQRRNQKVVEIAPAAWLSPEKRKEILEDALKIMRSVNYQNAGTVEFLYDSHTGEHYFIEVNARLQVEHTVSEEITGIDIVKSQIFIRQGEKLKDIGLVQDDIRSSGCAIQVRITAENSLNNFIPSSGTINELVLPGGHGVRVDSAMNANNTEITPYFDSLIMKLICKGENFHSSVQKTIRAINEMKISGLETNIPFVRNVLSDKNFQSGDIDTQYIDKNPQLKAYDDIQFSTFKLLKYLADVYVNGPKTPLLVPGAVAERSNIISPSLLRSTSTEAPNTKGWKKVLDEKGPKEFAQMVRKEKKLLLTDTTYRDAHQSLLATRVRTKDILNCATATNQHLENLFSLENWGGATYDVCYRFLRECPWERLEKMRELIPNIPFQMLLRGANSVGYQSYPDNVVFEFCKVARKAGIDVFRVFDSLNYLDNLKMGIDAVGSAGGVVEGAIAYTGDCINEKEKQYTIEYYMKLVDELVRHGIHILCIKDMAGILSPLAARKLISTIRREHPDLPIHLHTHDTAGFGIATYMEACQNDVDIVDCAIDSMSSLTSQPSMGSLVAALRNEKERCPEVTMESIQELSGYWESVRRMYAAFECTNTLKSPSSDAIFHEIPGGQYTNLHMQSYSLGLANKWKDIKKSYQDANELMGNIVKVTPSSKVVGDLANFMVSNNLSKEDVMENADNLSFPNSVVEYFSGVLGQPSFGFPEKLQKGITKNVKKIYRERPGKELENVNWEQVKEEMVNKYGKNFNQQDVLSYVMYEGVFDEYIQFRKQYGDLSDLPTPAYFHGLKQGEHVMEKGMDIKLISSVADIHQPHIQNVVFHVNSKPIIIAVQNKKMAEALNVSKAGGKQTTGKRVVPHIKRTIQQPTTTNDEIHVRSIVEGTINHFYATEGKEVAKGDVLFTINLNEVNSSVAVVAPHAGTILQICKHPQDSLQQGEHVISMSRK